jgi:hypothetical protein
MDADESPSKDQSHSQDDGENSEDSVFYKWQQFLEDYLNSQAITEDSYNDPDPIAEYSYNDPNHKYELLIWGCHQVGGVSRIRTIKYGLESGGTHPSGTSLARTSNNSKLQIRPLVREGTTK